MDSSKRYSIVCAVNDVDVLKANLLRSPNIREHELILMQEYNNVCKAYNDAFCTNDIVIYVHQDVYLPKGFFNNLDQALEEMYRYCLWGVLGVAGRVGDEYVGNILDRGVKWGSADGLPSRVQTLDELMLITHKGMFKFDEYIPNNHLYGADLCMQAASIGRMCFAINAYCEHNSTQSYELPDEFGLSKNYLRNKWWHMLPIYTTCAVIEK